MKKWVIQKLSWLRFSLLSIGSSYNSKFSDTVKSNFDTVNDTVFSLIEKNKQITTKEISEKLSVSLSTVKRKLNVLKQNSNLERIGSDKTGYWRIKIK